MALPTDVKQGIISRLKLLTGRSDTDAESLFGQLVDDAVEDALNFTHRTEVLGGMLKPIGDLALVAYNRLGCEGELSRTEGGEKYEFESMPKSIYSQLKGYRLARVNGHAYEKKSDSDEEPAEQDNIQG